MMSQRFSLFYAGFTAYAPALYYHQLEFIDHCQDENDEAVRAYISELSSRLGESVYESDTHIKTAISLAEHFELEVSPRPDSPQDYFLWLGHYIESVERQFPMARIDHYYFLFARKVSEILCNLRLLKTYIDLQLRVEAAPDVSRKMDKCLKDTEYILFKLMAAAALLSSEPRQNYFNVYYKLLCEKYIPLKGIEAHLLGKAEMTQLVKALETYELVVMDGFKKCIALLKELGI
jgi:hypothetical protein